MGPQEEIAARQEKQFLGRGPDPPIFSQRPIMTPIAREYVGGLVDFRKPDTIHIMSSCQNYKSTVAKNERADFSPGFRETICNEHTITDYLLAIKRITTPFSR